MQSKEIINYPDYIIYENGMVFSTKQNKTLAPVKSNKYYYIRLYGKTIKNSPLHSLVLEHFGVDMVKTKYIRHLDGNKLNNHINNLVYCEFKDLMDSTKIRAKGKKRKKIISFSSKIEAYKYYFQFISSIDFPSYFSTMGYKIELEVIKQRWVNKRHLTAYETAFKMYCSGMKTNTIIKELGWSGRTYNKAFNAVRLQLINEIMADIKKGILVYNSVPKTEKPSQKKSLKIWNDFKAQFQ
jgi:hypothetical protein